MDLPSPGSISGVKTESHRGRRPTWNPGAEFPVHRSQLQHDGVSHLYSNNGEVWYWPKMESTRELRTLMRARGVEDIEILPEPFESRILHFKSGLSANLSG